MAIGWIGFDADASNNDAGKKYDTKINTVDKYEKKQYDDISLITGFDGAFVVPTVDAVGGELFKDYLYVDKALNEVLWCFFDEDGTLAQNEWYDAWGLWYFSYGAYAVLGDYQVAIELNGSAQTDKDKFLVEDGEGFYGFAIDGHMLVGWEKYVQVNENAQNGALTDDDTPYEDKGADKAAKTTDLWTYYHTDGRQVNTTKADPKNPKSLKYNNDIYEGWELIEDNWCYFIQDTDLGMLLLQNDFVYDALTDDGGKLDANGNKGTFYVDANGFLVKNLKTFAKDAEIGTWDEANTSASTIKFAAAPATFLFGAESGNMLYGIQDRYYFLTESNKDDYVYEVIQGGDNKNIVEQGKITLTMADYNKATEGTTSADLFIEGQRLDGKNFFVVIDEANHGIDWNADKKYDKVFVYYFESGRMQKNQAIKFGSVTIAIDANGCVLGVDNTLKHDDKVTVAGHTFKIDMNDAQNVIELGGTVLHGVQK